MTEVKVRTSLSSKICGNKEQEKIKKEESDNINKKYQAIEMAKESIQKAQIKRRQNEEVKIVENNAIRGMLKETEAIEQRRQETQRANKMISQNHLKQFLDLQVGARSKVEGEQKEADKVILKAGLSKEGKLFSFYYLFSS